jgi:two-component system LytT family response regulator
MTDKIRVLVVDDEPLARSGLSALCERDSDLEVVGECSDGRAAVTAIRRLEPDLLLLDVQMPEMDGFEVLRTVGADRMPQVVFVTAFDEFAVQAFDVHALDYLLKPFDDERFFVAIERAKQALREPTLGQLSRRLIGLLESNSERTAGQYLTRLAVKDVGRVYFIRADEIVWIQAANYYAKLHVGGRVHLLRESMSSLESRLDPAKFIRVSRSAIVNLDRVREVQPFSRGSHIIILDDGARVKLSHSRKEKLEKVLGQSF